jgi:hypothetical protein
MMSKFIVPNHFLIYLFQHLQFTPMGYLFRLGESHHLYHPPPFVISLLLFLFLLPLWILFMLLPFLISLLFLWLLPLWLVCLSSSTFDSTLTLALAFSASIFHFFLATSLFFLWNFSLSLLLLSYGASSSSHVDSKCIEVEVWGDYLVISSFSFF